jgi:hypothetical protein
LGDTHSTNTQLANDAYMLLQGKESNLSDKQTPFARDILSSYQVLEQLDEWEKQFQPAKTLMEN